MAVGRRGSKTRTKPPRIDRNAALFYREGKKGEAAKAAEEQQNPSEPQKQQPSAAQGSPKNNAPGGTVNTGGLKQSTVYILAILLILLALLVILYGGTTPTPQLNETITANYTTTASPDVTFSATGSAYCNYIGPGSDGFPVYKFGMSGSATAPESGQFEVRDSKAQISDISSAQGQYVSCASWSESGDSAYVCQRYAGQPSSSSWSSYYEDNFYSGATVYFVVVGTSNSNAQVLTQASAQCPSCGDYPDQIRC